MLHIILRANSVKDHYLNQGIWSSHAMVIVADLKIHILQDQTQVSTIITKIILLKFKTIALFNLYKKLQDDIIPTTTRKNPYYTMKFPPTLLHNYENLKLACGNPTSTLLF